jgi:hypothetical protein
MSNIDIVKQAISLLVQSVPPEERQPLQLIEDSFRILATPKASDRCKETAEIFQRYANASFGENRQSFLFLVGILQISAVTLAECEKAMRY